MNRICVTGFYGFGCAGDEGILLSIMDSLGDNNYVVCTSLPYALFAEYKAKLPPSVAEVRQIYDIRSDYDSFILGGGGLSWGYGWRQALNAFAHEKPSMNYAVSYRFDELYQPWMNTLYQEFLARFFTVTVRDRLSKEYVDFLEIDNKLTACPSINLREDKFDCPENMIAVCPRYEDYPRENKPQLDWLTERLKDVSDEVLLIPFAPYNLENLPVDMELCVELRRRLKGSQILQVDGFNPRKVKYAISKSKLVITGGRYHALVWASAHNVPFEICPTSSHLKVWEFEKMHKEFGSDKLKEMEKENVKVFRELLK